MSALRLFVVCLPIALACFDDVYEPNDSSETSTVIPQLPFTAINLTLCSPTDVADWFNITVLEDGFLTIVALWDAELKTDGDLNIYLTDPSNNATILSPSTYWGAIAFQAPVTRGHHLLEVVPVRLLTKSGTYDLFVSWKASPVCVEDRLEPDGSFLTAANVPDGGQYYPNLSLCGQSYGDINDYFKLQIRDTTELHVEFWWEDVAAFQPDLVVAFLYAQDGATVLYQTQLNATSMYNQTRSFTVTLTAGVYYLDMYNDWLGLDVSSYAVNMSWVAQPLSSSSAGPDNLAIGLGVMGGLLLVIGVAVMAVLYFKTTLLRRSAPVATIGTRALDMC